MTSENRGYGPDNMGDDEQETEVAEWERYIEDPPEGELKVREDDDDAEEDYDWAERHPRDTGHNSDVDEAQGEVPAERSAVRERRNP